MKIISWNVNSIRARHDRCLALLERHRPDVLCLQELKVQEDVFDREAFGALGYHCTVLGQPTYNGVALLSLAEPESVVRGLPGDEEDTQARFLGGVFRHDGEPLHVYCSYVPNGGEVDGPRWAHKLQWMDRWNQYFRENHTVDQSVVLCGDFNVAPTDMDAGKPELWKDGAMTHTDIRTRLNELVTWGLRDLYREKYPEGQDFTWWDYRQLAFPKNNGLRIDFVLATDSMASRCEDVVVDRDERKGSKPSDHAPVVATFG